MSILNENVRKVYTIMFQTKVTRHRIQVATNNIEDFIYDLKIYMPGFLELHTVKLQKKEIIIHYI